MESVKCPVCATSNLASAVFCTECGYLLQEEQPSVEGAAAAPARTSGWFALLPDGSEAPLSPGENLVGRTEGVVLISDGFVSRKHAILAVDGRSLMIEDLGSTNGTFVDGVRLSPHMPVPVDERSAIKFGQTPITLKYVPPEGEAETNPPEPEAQPEEALPPAKDIPSLEPVHMLEPTLAEQLEAEEAEPVAEELSGYVLAVVEGSPAGETRLKAGATTFGRKSDKSDVAFPFDAFISGLHFVVEVSPDGVFVTDLGSTNGTFIGDTKLAPHEKVALAEGAVIAVGKTKLVLKKA
jgi:pSer/pThr/pTyr-binding forkhead associated (FHA) protein